MGVKATSRQSKDSNEASDFANGSRDPQQAANAGGPTSSSKPLDKQSTMRRKVDSVLDDVMGDPEDFRDFADSDGESGGGRWEDTVRAALEHEEAGNGAAHQDSRESEGEHSKGSREVSSKISEQKSEEEQLKGSAHGPSSSGDPGFSGQHGKGRLRKSHDSEGRMHSSHVPRETSASKQGKTYQTRYFIIKSLNHHNIAKSIENGIWATQAMNEPVLNEAYESSERVLLVFSVNMSGHFQGYAQMASPIGRRRANVWTEGNEGTNPWGGSFRVEWLRLHDLPFQKTVHLKNPLNFHKPVKISRDCQELTLEIGDALCALIDEGADREGKPKRKVVLADLAAHTSKKKRGDAAGMPPDIAFRQQIVPASNGGPHVPGGYIPHFQGGNPHEPFPSTGSLGRVSGGFLNQVCSPLDTLRVSRSKSPHPATSDKSMDWDRDHDRDHRRRERERPVDWDRHRDARSSSSGRIGDVPIEEDLLNMTYEEYLLRHGHAKDSSGYHQGAGPYAYNQANPVYGGSWMGKNPGMGSSDDQYSNYIANWYSRQGPASVGDGFIGNGLAKNYPAMASTCPQWNWKGDDVRPRRLSRTLDGKPGSHFWEQNGRASRCIEHITQAGS
ncbi:hypothetical protein Mapa_007815 [Marchantia paleacea]|nr:hypothetical protein Mapa_007815 [Marchantia paleacea]